MYLLYNFDERSLFTAGDRRKTYRSTYQKFYSKFQRKILSYLKNFSPRRSTQEKICQRHEFTQIIRFSEGVIGVAKIASSLNRLHGEIFLSLGEHFFAGFIPGVLFSGQRENTPGKNPAETQSMKIQVKSGEILVRKYVGKIMQNVDIPRVTPHSAKLT